LFDTLYLHFFVSSQGKCNIFNMLYPLLFETSLFPIVWGGHRLREIKGLPQADEPVGESWEVSAVPGKESVVANGNHAGKNLAQLVGEYGEELLGKYVHEKFNGEFPMLVKFIDAESDLSIQVHPNNEQASERHGSMGKTEMWYVVDAKPGTYLYAGFAKSITPEEYCRKVEDGTICEVLAKHNISAGDAFFIPAGRVHAICGGALIAEVQQSSDITYRIYDYGRMGMDGKPRELHTELAKDVMDYAVHKEYSVNYAKDENQSNLICECEYFTVNKMKLTEVKQRNLKHLESFLIYICIGGECKVGDSLVLKYGQTCLIPASCADVTITPLGNDGTVELMEVYVNKV
jgi:mannose-6-phosphate isomerase